MEPKYLYFGEKEYDVREVRYNTVAFKLTFVGKLKAIKYILGSIKNGAQRIEISVKKDRIEVYTK